MRLTVMLLVVSLFIPTAVFAQHIELQPFFGLRFGGGWSLQEAIPGSRLPLNPTFDSGVAWGGTVGFALWERAEVEFLFSRHETAMSAESFDAAHNPLVAGAATQYGGNVLLYWVPTGMAVRPYIMFGASATSISLDGDMDGVTRGSFSLGGGVKVFTSPNLGFRLQLRYTPTYVTGTSTMRCDSSCASTDVADYMHQGELTSGVVFRF